MVAAGLKTGIWVVIEAGCGAIATDGDFCALVKIVAEDGIFDVEATASVVDERSYDSSLTNPDAIVVNVGHDSVEELGVILKKPCPSLA